MDRHPLGNTPLQVTPLGLGLAALGRPGYITLGHAQDLAIEPNAPYSIDGMQAHTHAMLDFAWQQGVRYFDAALYGRAEAFLGTWLASRAFEAHDLPVVGSKWGYVYTADWRVQAAQHEVKDHSLPLLQRQWRESQQLLGHSLNLYQIHSATLDSGVLTRAEVLTELAVIKEKGVRVGLSLSGVTQSETLAVALEVEIEGQRLFDTVQATWNLLEPSCGPLLATVCAEGMGVIIKEALANGRLTQRNQAPDFAPQLATLTAIARRHNTSIDAIALAATLAQPWADIVLSGAATPEQLASNFGALTITLTPEDWDDLHALAEPPASYWSTRSRLEWN